MAITYTITENGSLMVCSKSAEVAEHVVLAGATYIVQGTPQEQAEGRRKVDKEIAKLRSNANQ